MAIPTNVQFDLYNAAPAKRPLYVLRIDGLATAFTTFRPQDMQVAVSGYGMSAYGTTGYGY